MRLDSVITDFFEKIKKKQNGSFIKDETWYVLIHWKELMEIDSTTYWLWQFLYLCNDIAHTKWIVLGVFWCVWFVPLQIFFLKIIKNGRFSKRNKLLLFWKIFTSYPGISIAKDEYSHYRFFWKNKNDRFYNRKKLDEIGVVCYDGIFIHHFKKRRLNHHE